MYIVLKQVLYLLTTGQLNLMMADVGDLTEAEDYLRGIWTNLGVGKNGYIDIAELSRVCSHIGMEQMNDTVSYMYYLFAYLFYALFQL